MIDLSKRKIKYKIRNSKISPFLIIITLSILVGLAFNRAVNISINSKAIMHCNSARISGNAEYLKKCDCYYSTGDITCIDKGVK